MAPRRRGVKLYCQPQGQVILGTSLGVNAAHLSKETPCPGFQWGKPPQFRGARWDGSVLDAHPLPPHLLHANRRVPSGGVRPALQTAARGVIAKVTTGWRAGHLQLGNHSCPPSPSLKRTF